MNIKYNSITFLAALFLLFSNASNAADPLGKEALEKLITGNTAEGQAVQWEKGMTWYFHKTGKIKKFDEYGNRGKGEWMINDDGYLCVKFKHGKERCRSVVPRTDGGYDVYGTDRPEADELKWTFERILPGNPHDL
ncbi:MAG: hypothetical protein GQ550_09960 [Gammaproteobacteria bacterium]|nr:hypothetical protein [Gammaproteobacteria bacterium]